MLIRILAGLVTVLGAVFIRMFVRGRRRAGGGQSWEEAPGKVTAAKMRVSRGAEGGESYEPRVSYQYKVGGRSLHGHRVRLASPAPGDRPTAQRVLDAYPEGKAVTVFYDPAKPESAVLEVGTAGNARLLYLGIACLALGLLAPFLFSR
jgi:hypothetical protein